MNRLHGRDDTEITKTRDIERIDMLRMLDAPTQGLAVNLQSLPDTFVDVQRLADRAITDRRVKSLTMLAPVFQLRSVSARLVPLVRHFVRYIKKNPQSRANHLANHIVVTARTHWRLRVHLCGPAPMLCGAARMIYLARPDRGQPHDRASAMTVPTP